MLASLSQPTHRGYFNIAPTHTRKVSIMIANYHTHTWRCHHAEPDEEAYIRTAYASGIRVLGFADHVPYPYDTIDKNYVSGPRMSCDQLPDYMNTLTALKEKYKGEIDIHIGFEAEYYPDLFSHLLEMLKPWPCEYFILGQHFLGNEIGEIYCGVPTQDPKVLYAYREQCRAAMDTGAFSYFAHPDLLYLPGDEKAYRSHARELCRIAKSYGVPIEFNLLGYISHRHYPSPAFWEEASVVGNKVILGWDAHTTHWMSQTDKEAEAIAYLNSLGLHPIDFLTFMSPYDHRK